MQLEELSSCVLFYGDLFALQNQAYQRCTMPRVQYPGYHNIIYVTEVKVPSEVRHHRLGQDTLTQHARLMQIVILHRRDEFLLFSWTRRTGACPSGSRLVAARASYIGTSSSFVFPRISSSHFHLKTQNNGSFTELDCRQYINSTATTTTTIKNGPTSTS